MQKRLKLAPFRSVPNDPQSAFDHSLPEMKEWTDSKVTLLGNIPPRDVLADGGPSDVRRAAKEALDSIDDKTRLILSCGGGMPPGVSTENIQAFLSARL